LNSISSDDINIFAERIETFILTYSQKNEHKIWLNYKILEAEIERIYIEYFAYNN